MCGVSSALYLTVPGTGPWSGGGLHSERRSLSEGLRLPFIMCLFSVLRQGAILGFIPFSTLKNRAGVNYIIKSGIFVCNLISN